MPIGFYALPEVIKDINQMNRDWFKYYGDVLHCISVNETSHKVIYACCNPKPFAHNDLYFDADSLIISMVSDDGVLNDGTKLIDTPLRDEILTLDDIL